ncbi:MAG: spore coat protein U domain-containing protein [Limnobacter sp.]|nr:spore coat protein U domain-containing protein [Limnobacter sp.]
MRALLVVLCLLLSPSAWAVTVLGSCNFTLTSTPGLSYTVQTAAQTQASTLNINCSAVLTLVSSFNYTVSYGGGSAGNVANRSMVHSTDAASRLAYTLRASSSASSTLLGDGTGGTSIQSGVLNCLIALLGNCLSGTTQVNLNSWLHVPARQFVRPGSYADSMVVTITLN